MTDEQALYVTLVVLYLVECAAWVQRGSAAFVGKVGEARVVFPRRGLSNNRGGLVLGPIVPLRGATFLVPQWPVSMAAKGVLGWVAESLELAERAFQSGVYRRFDDFKRARADGRDVSLDGEEIAQAPSLRMARRVAEGIEALRALDEGARPAAIEAMLSTQMDAAGARRQVEAFYRETRALRAASLVVVIIAFAVWPAVVIGVGLEGTWLLLLGVTYLATWVVAALFFRAHRRLFPEARAERWGQTALVALLPISAMRASDAIARTLLHGYHPLAAAIALAPPARVAELSGHLIRDARSPRRPVCVNEEAEAQAVEAWYREALRKAVERAARGAGVDVDKVTAAPAPEDASIRSYCPRCLAQYGEDTKVCADCGDVPVMAI